VAPYSPQPAALPAGLRAAAGQDDPKDPKADIPPDLKPSDPRVTAPPRRADVFAFPNDANLERVIIDRLREEEAKRVDPTSMMPPDPYARYPKGTAFPPLPDIGGGAEFVAKTEGYPPSRVNYEPGYVVHRRLHFEEKNSERYGWDLGIVQPLVSTLYFYKDVLLWPNSLASGCAYGFWDTNAGKCLPGSPTPYFLYPPGLTITGTAFEGVIITGAAFIFP
jgi:hypothetical protein